MNIVIKSTVARGAVRALGATAPARVLSQEAQAIAALSERLAGAEEEIANLTADLERLTKSAKAACDDAHARGVIEGKQSAQDDGKARLSAVTDAARSARAALDERLSALDDAVGILAGAALERIVGDPSHRRDLVRETASRAVHGAFADTVIAVEVAQSDFPDPSVLTPHLPDGCQAIVSTTLPSGACRLRLKLGEANLDLDGQAAKLRALLTGRIGE